jgi:WD40 repeat protein
LHRTLAGHQNIVLAVAADPKGRIATGSFDGSALLWDIDSGQVLSRFDDHSRAVDAIAFSPDGTMLATGSWDGKVKLWDVTTRMVRHTLVGHSSEVTGVAFSPDGKMLATVGRDEYIRLWDAATGGPISAYSPGGGPILAIAFSPDGETIATGHADGLGRVHPVERLMPIADNTLIERIRARVSRDFTADECRQYSVAPACSRTLAPRAAVSATQ